MKHLRTIVIIGLLFGLPAGSWFFLQHGLDWRREKRTQLVPKQDLLKEVKWTTDEFTLVQNNFKDHTTLLLCGAQDVADKAIIDQFKDAYTFQVKEAAQLPQSIVAKLNATELNYLLIDTGMVVRQVYPDNKKKTIQRLVEDLALIIPQQPVKEIKLRGRDND